jgi:purine-binding chemotaxis protein CheW
MNMDEHAELSHKFVVFLVENETFAINMAPVQEIIRVPDIIKVPMAPSSLLGLANLRGKVLPVVSMREVFGLPGKNIDEANRIIVLDIGQPVGFLVDAIWSVVSVEDQNIDYSTDVKTIIDSELLQGIIKNTGKFDMIIMLDIDKIIEKEFSSLRQQSLASASMSSNRQSTKDSEEEDEDTKQFLSFTVAGETYAVSVDHVQEVVQMPDSIAKVPDAESSIAGIINLRNSIIPVADMKKLFNVSSETQEKNKRVIILSIENTKVGVIVDSVKEVLRIQESLIEPVPSVVFSDKEQSSIVGVYRLTKNSKEEIVFVVSVHKLFKHSDIKEVVKNMDINKNVEENEELKMEEDEDQFVIFKLDNQEYGIHIQNIQEIVRVPEELSKVPKTQSFMEGVVNLRGKVLPVINLRKKFGLQDIALDDHNRIIVFVKDGIFVGFIVDSVHEVLKIPKNLLQESKAIFGKDGEVFDKIANLDKQKRMIQIINPEKLLDQKDMEDIEELAYDKGANR